MTVYMVWVKSELIEFVGPGISFEEQIGIRIRAWAWENAYRYFVRVYDIYEDNTTIYSHAFKLGFTDPNAAFEFKMRFG